MRIALIQQHATPDKSENVARGLRVRGGGARRRARGRVCRARASSRSIRSIRRVRRPGRMPELVPGPITDAFAAPRPRARRRRACRNLFERDGDQTYDSARRRSDADDGALLGLHAHIHNHRRSRALSRETGALLAGMTPARPVYRTKVAGADRGRDLPATANIREHTRALGDRRRGPRGRPAGGTRRRVAGAITKSNT